MLCILPLDQSLHQTRGDSPLGGWFSLGLAVTAVVVSSILVACGERPFVVAAAHPSPGGWGYAVWSFVVPPIVGGIVGWFVSAGVAVCGAVAMFLVFAAEAVWVKVWKPSMSAAEVQEAWGKTTQMTRDMTAEDRREKGWVNPPRKCEDRD
ncbi:hypothetical protein [Micrococcus sp. KRD128]|uniref:hypothetical protein n=1 Tax=Micrococcus sp. KRD128 TaxID=2729722 RepID=UPI0019D0673F|nr:hypothetical protein [Micrococcus sp. KRD128]